MGKPIKFLIAAVVLAIFVVGGFFAWKYFGMPQQKLAEVTAEAVWALADTNAIPELQKCHLSETFTALSRCVVPIMKKYEASPEAIEFFRKTNYWFLTGFQERGKVDLAKISTPWRANDNTQYALVNGFPSIVNVQEEASEFSLKNLTNYNDMVSTFPKYSLWSGDNEFLTQEGESFLFSFDLKNEFGCHACSSGYQAVISFNFKDGNYLGPKLVNFCVSTSTASFTNLSDPRFSSCDQFKKIVLP